MSDVYRFTTYNNDFYFRRIIDEVRPETNFLIVTERTVNDPEKYHVALLYKQDALKKVAEQYPNFTLTGQPIGEWLMGANEYEIAAHDTWHARATSPMTHANADKVLDRLRSEVRRIVNVLTGHVLKVTVESF